MDSTGKGPEGTQVGSHTRTLFRTEELARQVLHLLEGPVFVLDISNHVVFANRAFAEAVGQGLDCIEGRALADLFNGGERPEWLYEALKHARSEQVSVHDGWLQLAGAGRRFLRCKFKVVAAHGSGDNEKLLVVQCRDLTEQQELDRRRRRSLAVQEQMLAHTPALIWVCGPDGKPFFYNQSWLDLTGLSQMEALRDGWLPLVHMDERDLVAERIGRAIAGREKLRLDCRLLSSTGDYVWVLLEGRTILNDEGRFDSYIFAAQQVSDYKVRELQIQRDLEFSRQMRDTALAQKAEADRKSEEKSAYLAMASHEIRTPLNPVIGFADLLTANESLDEESREMSQMILRAGKNLLNLIDDVLDYAKIDSGALKLSPEPIDVQDLVLELEQHHRFDAQSRGIELELSCDARIHEELYGDRMRLHQVLGTVLSHSFRMTPEGTVKLHAFTEQTGGPQFLHFKVSSDAQALAAEEAADVFTPFRRPDEEMGDHRHGSGLGMAISRKLVEMMAGTITFSSTEEGGSVFEIIVPHVAVPQHLRARRDEAEGSKKAAVQSPKQEATVLIVDDEASSRRVNRSLMEFLGYKCDEAASAEELMKRLAQNTYELVLLDIMLPGGDGYEITQLIRNGELGEGNRGAFIVAVTGCSEAEGLERSKQVGMNDFISKPLTTSQLRRMLERFKSSNSRRSVSSAS